MTGWPFCAESLKSPPVPGAVKSTTFWLAMLFSVVIESKKRNRDIANDKRGWTPAASARQPKVGNAGLCCGREIDITKKLAALAEHRSAAAGDGPGCDFATRQRQRLQRIE